MTKSLHRMLLLAPWALLACDPGAKNLGIDDAGAPRDIEWRMESGVDVLYRDVAALPDGGALLIEYTPDLDRTAVLRVAADGGVSILLEETSLSSGQVLPIPQGVFLTANRYDSGQGGSRASVRRLDLDGTFDAEYVHRRERQANAFSRQLAASNDELALVIGNWGGLDEGESWFLVQRLDMHLQPVGEPLPFEHEVKDVAFDAQGRLLILEVPAEGPGLLHRPDHPEPPQTIDCDTLLHDAATPLCASTLVPGQILDLDGNPVLDADLPSLGPFAYPMRAGPNSLFFGVDGEQGPAQLVEVLDDGALDRVTVIADQPDALGATPLGIVPTADGAAFGFALEYYPPPQCPDDDDCFRSYLVRLAP